MAVRFRHELLARARVDLGLTQEDAARAIGVDVRTYRRYESGEVNEAGGFGLQRASRRSILERMRRELGIPESELVTDQPSCVPAIVLPRARHFVGRARLLGDLVGWLANGKARSRIVAVVAVGGAGKTSLVERALTAWQAGAPGRTAVVHSFYDEPGVDVFLDRASASLGAAEGDPLDRLLGALGRAPGSVLVLDGLELAQASGEEGRTRGELEDRRLVRLLRAIARDAALGRVLVTSRFPLVDLAGFEGDGMETIALPPLDAAETAELLGRWGIRAGAVSLGAVHAKTGGHALSVAVTASYAGEFLDGDVEAAVGIDLADVARDEPLAGRLRAMLSKYAAELAPLERDLLGHVCIFPRGIDEAGLSRLPRFAETRATVVRTSLARLVRRGLAVAMGNRLTAHPFIRDHFRAFVSDAPAVHENERARLASHLAQQLEGRPLHRPEGQSLLDACESLFEHTLLSGDAPGAHALFERSLGGFEHLGLRLGEFERALRMTRALADGARAMPADVRRRVIYDRGLCSAALGDLDGAVRAYREVLAVNDVDTTVHRTLAYTLRLRGDLVGAHAHVDRSIELARRAELAPAQARGVALRGAIFTSEGRLAEAGEAFEVARALGDVPMARRAIWEAEYLLAKGERSGAAALLRDNLAACERRGWAGHVAHCNVVLGRVALAEADLPAAESALARAMQWCTRSREVELLLWATLLDLGLAAAKQDPERARRSGERARDAATLGSYGLILAILDAAAPHPDS